MILKIASNQDAKGYKKKSSIFSPLDEFLNPVVELIGEGPAICIRNAMSNSCNHINNQINHETCTLQQ